MTQKSRKEATMQDLHKMVGSMSVGLIKEAGSLLIKNDLFMSEDDFRMVLLFSAFVAVYSSFEEDNEDNADQAALDFIRKATDSFEMSAKDRKIKKMMN